MSIIKTDFQEIKDERGVILKIAENVDVLRIGSVKGSKRAAHYHKTSSHLCCLITGFMTYYERPANSNVKPTKVDLLPTEYFFTGPQVEHLMVFNEDSVFDCYSFGSRNKENYENDLVRISVDLEKVYNEWKE